MLKREREAEKELERAGQQLAQRRMRPAMPQTPMEELAASSSAQGGWREQHHHLTGFMAVK